MDRVCHGSASRLDRLYCGGQPAERDARARVGNELRSTEHVAGIEIAYFSEVGFDGIPGPPLVSTNVCIPVEVVPGASRISHEICVEGFMNHCQ